MTDVYLAGGCFPAAVTVVVALSVAMGELVGAVSGRPTSLLLLLPRGDTERPGLDQDGDVYAGVGGGASADVRTRQIAGRG